MPRRALRRARSVPRAVTLTMRQLRGLRVLEELTEATELRPRTRAECQGGPRPCPWVGCRWHLYLDVNPQTGSIKLNFAGRDLDDLEHTCALDVADTGVHTLDQVGELTNLTRERVRQVEVKALVKLKGVCDAEPRKQGDE